MANDDDKSTVARIVQTTRGKPKVSDRPFDMWLQKQLHAMYDEIASEPLPDDLVNLIDKDAAQDDSAANGGSRDLPNKVGKQ